MNSTVQAMNKYLGLDDNGKEIIPGTDYNGTVGDVITTYDQYIESLKPCAPPKIHTPVKLKIVTKKVVHIRKNYDNIPTIGPGGDNIFLPDISTLSLPEDDLQLQVSNL